jgi:NTE family protein
MRRLQSEYYSRHRDASGHHWGFRRVPVAKHMKGRIAKVRSDRGLLRFCPAVAYVLSGGAASGLCHLGMIEALENRGIMPDLIVGTSAGALFGSLYCHFGNIKEVFTRVAAVLTSDEFAEFEKKYFGEKKPATGAAPSRMRHFLSGLAGTLKSGMHLGKALVTSAMVAEKDAVSIFGKVFEGITFQTLRVPFAAVAVDLAEGVPVIFSSEGEIRDGATVRVVPGPDGLVKAVMASCAIPLIFPAVEIGGHAHADGYIMSNLPVREARLLLGKKEAFFVGCDVSAPVELSEEDLSTVELILRLLELATRSKQRIDRDLIDVLLQPVDRSYPWSSFAQSNEFFDIGRRYMSEERLDALEDAYIARCAANVSQDPNVARKLFSRARLTRSMAATKPRG